MSRRFNIKNELEKLYVEVPKALLYEPKYKGDKDKKIKPLSNDAKLLYGIFLDRTYLSIHKATEEGNTKFIDENGDIFIYFVNEAIAEIMNVGLKKAIAIKKELAAFGLLEEIQQGDKKANRLYLNIVETDKNNLSLYTNSFQDVVSKRKESEKIRIQEVRANKKSLAETVENTMNCQKDSTRTVKNAVPVLSKRQSSNTKEFSNTEFFSKTDFKKSDVDLFVLSEQDKKELTYNIQNDTSMTIEEKLEVLNKINPMSEHTRALVYDFIKYSILISDAQIKMLESMVYDIAKKSMEHTIAKDGKTFSYFYEVYKTKEQEDMAEVLNDFVFIPKFNQTWGDDK